MYKYELHCHTARTSACATLKAREIVDLFVANGYTGVFVTDHFLNGNTTVNRLLPFASYEEKIEEFCKGYEEVKLAADGKIDVFFGLEASYLGTDILIYGWDKEQLKELPQIEHMDFRKLCEFCRERDVLAVHAHPFREDYYIDHIRLYPQVEGIEVLNSGRNELCNKLGNYYAECYGKIKTGGSDIHHASHKMLSGMEFDEKITDVRHFIRLLREGKGKILYSENVYKRTDPIGTND